MTALERAVEEVKKAAGVRPWILLIDAAHDDAPVASAVQVHVGGRAVADYVALGLLNKARVIVETAVASSARISDAEDE